MIADIKQYAEFKKLKELTQEEQILMAEITVGSRALHRLHLRLDEIGDEINKGFNAMKARAGFIGNARVQVNFEKGTLEEVPIEKEQEKKPIDEKETILKK